MTLYAAIWYDTDEFTYGCDTVLGVFDDRSKADECILKWAETRPRELENCSVDVHEINTSWYE